MEIKEIEDVNEIITIQYRDLKFEIDMVNDIALFPEDIYDLFPENENHIEIQPLNLFFRRLIDNWELKNKIKTNDYNNDDYHPGDIIN